MLTVDISDQLTGTQAAGAWIFLIGIILAVVLITVAILVYFYKTVIFARDRGDKKGVWIIAVLGIIFLFSWGLATVALCWIYRHVIAAPPKTTETGTSEG